MDLSTFIVAVFCLVDDRLEGRRIRQRGPDPKLSDSEILSVEIVGEFLGIEIPTRASTSSSRGTTGNGSRPSRRCIADHLRQAGGQPLEGQRAPLAGVAPPCPSRDPGFALVDSMPLPACLFARAYRCKRLAAAKQPSVRTLSSSRPSTASGCTYIRVCRPGVITRFSVAPANTHELSVLPEVVESTSGLLVGDRNYHAPKTKEELAPMNIELLAAYSSKKRDLTPIKSAFLSRLRYRIDTVFSQLTGR
jgi:hypothetical protein